MHRLEVWAKGLLAAAIAGVSAIMSSLIGVAAYLKQSPLPSE